MEEQPERAAAMLAPAGAGRHGNVVTFSVGARRRRLVAGSGHAAARAAGRRADRRQCSRRSRSRRARRPGLASRRAPLGEQWEQAQASLPADWSDLYAEVELDSSDYLERGALLLAPVNPARVKGRLAYRFRAARRFGYGASAEMTERCLQRLDGEGITGSFRVLWALSDTKPVSTQGPVWYAGGRAV